MLSKFKTLIRAYQEKGRTDFLRFLLLKEWEYRSFWRDKIRSWYNRQLLLAQGVELSDKVKIGPREIRIQKGEGGRVVFGSGVTIYSPIEITAATHIFSESHVRIGDRTRIGGYTSIRCAKEIIIGKDCLISSYVRIYDYNGHPIAPFDPHDHLRLRNCLPVPKEEVRPIKIGDNVWIGEKSFIQAGVTIGKNSIISANSVVTKNIPPNVIAFGCPARTIYWFDKDE